MNTTVTRREALTTAAAVAAVATVPAAPSNAAIGSAHLDWAIAWADFQRLEREADEAYRLYDVAATRYEALCPPQDMIDFAHLPGAAFVDRRHIIEKLDTAAAWSRFLAAEGRMWCSRDPEAYKAKVRAALDSLDSYRQQRDHMRAVTKLDHYGTLSDKTSDRLSEAEMALWNLPAPNGEALLWKCRRLFGNDNTTWAEGITDQTFADLERLLCGSAGA